MAWKTDRAEAMDALDAIRTPDPRIPAPSPAGRVFRHEICFKKSMGAKKQQTLAIDPHPAWRSPGRRQLDGLFDELAAFNERIAELVQQGHRSHAMRVLKAQALSLAAQIDELRCLLVLPKR